MKMAVKKIKLNYNSRKETALILEKIVYESFL